MTDETALSAEAWQRRATAYHEAAHSVANVLFGQPIGVVSIRAGEGYRGIMLLADSAVFVNAEPSTAVLLQPIEIRTSLEREIVATLAGDIAALFITRRTGYIEPVPCESNVEAAVENFAALSPRHRELLVSSEAKPASSFHDDDSAAWTLSWSMVGEPIESAMHLNWLRTVARNFVVEHWHQIEAVAAALLARTFLDGATVAAIVREAEAATGESQ